jgi:hypothetical protein
MEDVEANCKRVILIFTSPSSFPKTKNKLLPLTDVLEKY